MIMANPPKMIRGFEGATEKACIEASPRWQGWGVRGHALVVDPGWWLAPKKGKQNTAFKLTPTPCC